MTNPTGGTDIASLGLSVDSTQLADAGKVADKASASLIGVIDNLDDLIATSNKESEATSKATANRIAAVLELERQALAAQAVVDANKQVLKVQQDLEDSGTRLLVKLEELVKVFGLTREEVFRLQAAELGVTESAEPLIAELEALKAATKQYGVVIHEVAEIEAARIAFEESALTAFNAFKIRTMAENRAAAITDINELERERIAAIEREEARLTVFNAFKIRTMMENRAEAMAILTTQEEEAARLAEKQAIEEIAWNARSVQSRIAELNRLRAYQANPAISGETIGSTFSGAAINDVGNLNRYQKEYAESLAATATVSRRVAEETDVMNSVFSTARSRTELLVIAHEALQGRYSRIPGSLMVLAEYVNGASIAFTGMGVAALGTVAALALFAYETVKGIEQTKALNDALNRTNNISGETISSLAKLADATGSVHGNFKEAYAATAQLAASGKFTHDQIGSITSAVVELNHAFGAPIQTTIKEFESLVVHGTSAGASATMEVSKALAKLDEQYHFVDATLMQHIIHLEQEGKQQEASRLAIDAYTSEGERAAKAAEQYVGSIERGWNNVVKVLQTAKQWMADIGKENTLEQDRVGLQAQVDNMLGGVQGPRNRIPTQHELDVTVGLKDRYEELLSVQIRLTMAELEATATSKERAKQSEADHVLAQRAIEDLGRYKKGMNELQLAIEKENEETKRIREADPTYGTDSSSEFNTKYLQDRMDKVISDHTKKQSGIKNDGRKQDLQDELDYQTAQFKLVQDSYNAQEKAVHDAMLHGRMVQEDGYAQLKEARGKEMLALAAESNAKIALLNNYQSLGKIDAAETRKRLDQVTNDYFLAAQKIFENGIKNNGQQEDAVKKLDDATEKARTHELTALDKIIAKQKEHNAEIGKSKEQIDLARQAKEDEATVGLQAEADALDAVLKNSEYTTTLVGKDRERYEALLEYLNQEIDRRNEVSRLLGEAAKLEADAAIQRATDSSWKTVNKKIGDDLASAIVDGGGKGVRKLIHDMELSFAKAILRPILEPISSGIASMLYSSATQAGINGATGVGSAGGFVGIAAAASNLYSVMTKGFDAIGDNIASGVQKAFNFAGTSDAQAIGNSELAQSIGTLGQSVASLAAGHGLGDMISGQYSVGNHGQAVVNIATAVGEYLLPGIGGAIGGALGGLVNRLFGMGPQNVVSQGLRGTLSDSGTTATNYSNWHADGGFFRSDQNGTNTTAATADIINTFTAGLGQLKAASTDFAKTLGIGSDAIANYSKDFDITLTKDATANQKAITDFFAGIGNELATSLVPNIADFAKVGEAAATTLQRLSDTFKATDAIADLLGRTIVDTFGSVGIESDAARERLVTLAGGISQLTSETTSYVKNFLTDAEKLAPVQKAVTDALAAMGIAGISTKAEFKAIVDGLNLTTQAGAEEFQNLMALQGAYAQVADAQEAARLATAKAAQQTLDDAKKLADEIKAADQKRFSDTVSLQLQIATLEKNTSMMQMLVTEQRSLEIQALDASLQPLQERLNALKDEAAAAEKAAEAQKAYTESAIAATVAFKNASASYDAAVNAVSSAKKSVADSLRSIGDAVKAFADRVAATQTALDNSRDAISSEYFSAQDAVAQAQEKIISITQQAAVAMKGLSTNIQTFLNSLLTTSLGSGSPESQYHALQAQFDKDAQANDITAALKDANDLLTASKGFNASGAAFVADEAHVKSILESLKANADAASVGADNVTASEDPMLVAQKDLVAAQKRLNQITEVAAKSNANTDRNTANISNTATDLYKTFVKAQSDNEAAQHDYREALRLTQNMDLTLSDTMTSFRASLDTYSSSVVSLGTAITNLSAALQVLGVAKVTAANTPLGPVSVPSTSYVNYPTLPTEEVLNTAGVPFPTWAGTSDLTNAAWTPYTGPGLTLNGSHKDGLDYVPFDGYRAELHQGEKVQSVAQLQANAVAAKEMNTLLQTIVDKLDATIMQNGAVATEQIKQLDAVAAKLDTANRKLAKAGAQ